MADKEKERDAFYESAAAADTFLRKEYLQCLDQAKIVSLCLGAAPKESHLRMIHMDALFYDTEEHISEKIEILLRSVENYGETMLLILDGRRDRVDIYLGISSEQMPQPVFEAFRRSLSGLLPGCRYTTLHSDEAEQLMKQLLPEDETVHIAGVAAFPGADLERRQPGEKLDVLIDGMRHRPFSMFLLAKAVPADDLAAMRQSYCQLYTDFSPLEKMAVTLSDSSTQAVGQSFSQAVTKTLGYNSNISRGHSITRGGAVSTQEMPDLTQQKKHTGTMQLAGTAAALLVPAVMGGPVDVMRSVFYGSALSNIMASGEQMLGLSPQQQAASTVSVHQDESENENTTIGQNVGASESQQKGYSLNHNRTEGKTWQATQTNKYISKLLRKMEKELKYLSMLQGAGAYNVAAYFVAGDAETAVAAASLYRSISNSAITPVIHAPVCSWHEREQTDQLREYLSRGRHPIFRFEKNADFPQVQLAQMIGAGEVSRYFNLPERSISGFTVSPCASFARDVLPRSHARKSGKLRIPIGHIYHLGKEDFRTPVELDVNELTKHLFVSGATGVGKSNFCYHLLDQLDQIGIPILIVEPAKGEYRHVLGGRKGFRVFGVDPRNGPVLRINPFAYPKGISAIQHIERLLDIFNAAWPMYSAMPAIMKEAVEEIYLQRGFDLMTGERPESAEFPSVQDLEKALGDVIERSKYSAEVKGNYKGALETRVHSLTNGIYGVLFGQDELGDKVLFDSNVIADISRIGSSETKALLMGMLTMRLVEYRMAQGQMNAPLRHVTVLEEAHNLLRRHNQAAAEGANMRAASVEMISSAIAEMRSSGEGFIIADQSPAVMDWSVIRNTQTKIFFMLPEKEDRQIAASALALNDAQQQELSRLVPGVAAVYQNSWSDPVLCKIQYFDQSQACPYIPEPSIQKEGRRQLIGQAIALILERRLKDKVSSVDWKQIESLLRLDENTLDPYAKKAYNLLALSEGKPLPAISWEEDLARIKGLLPVEQLVLAKRKWEEFSDWINQTQTAVEAWAELSRDELECLISLVLHSSLGDPETRDKYIRYTAHCASKNTQ